MPHPFGQMRRSGGYLIRTFAAFLTDSGQGLASNNTNGEHE